MKRANQKGSPLLPNTLPITGRGGVTGVAMWTNRKARGERNWPMRRRCFGLLICCVLRREGRGMGEGKRGREEGGRMEEKKGGNKRKEEEYEDKM